MQPPDISRRKVLSAFAAAGSTGALLGSGTSALLTDTESFGSDGVNASAAVSGVVDMSIDVNERHPGVQYDVVLPTARQNNPAYIWVRTADCPDNALLASSLDASLTLSCQQSQTTLATGSALDLLNVLREGVMLTPPCTDRQCLQPGDTLSLSFDVAGQDDSGQIGGTLSFTLEFHGLQCRYDSGATNPFPTLQPCPGPTIIDGKAISFVAFCSEAETPNPRISSVNAVNADGEITSVEWESDAGVTYVIVKFANVMTIYDYSDSPKTSGIATVGDGSAAIPYYSVQPGEAATPCMVATRELGSSGDSFDGTQVKFESVETNSGGSDD